MLDLRVQVNGVDYSGWESVEVSLSIEALAGRFVMEVSESPEAFPVPPQAACIVYAGETALINGYVDSVVGDLGENQHTITLEGRDKTGDLVDCSAVNPSQEFMNISFTDLLNKLAAPFGVPVSVSVTNIEPFKKFSLQQESAFEAIERACRLRGVLPLPGPDGGIRIVAYGETRADVALVQGANIKSASVTRDFKDRYSHYIVYGQHPGDDDISGEATTALMGRARDGKITRKRPLVVMAEGAVTTATAQKRAEWEAAVRAARSETVRITVTGWEQAENGKLWMVNQIVPCELPILGIAGDMLVRDVTFVRNDNVGTVTYLGLVGREAYQRKPDQAEEKADAT